MLHFQIIFGGGSFILNEKNLIDELAGKLLAVKTIYRISIDEIRSGSEEGDWISELMIEELDNIYDQLTKI